MQKLYKIKYIVIGLVVTSASLSGMQTPATQENCSLIHQKRTFILYSDSLAKAHHQEMLEEKAARQQEKEILQFIEERSQLDITMKIPRRKSDECPII